MYNICTMAREVELKYILQQNAEESTISFWSTLATIRFEYKGFRSISLPAISNLAHQNGQGWCYFRFGKYIWIWIWCLKFTGACMFVG